MDFLRKRLPARVGRYLEGGRVPRPKGGDARDARAQRRAGPARRSAAREAAGGRVPRPPGRLGGPATGALACRRGCWVPLELLPRANFSELRKPEVRRIPLLRTRVNRSVVGLVDKRRPGAYTAEQQQKCHDAEPPGGTGGRGTHKGPSRSRGESPAKASVGLISFGPNPAANLAGAEEGGCRCP